MHFSKITALVSDNMEQEPVAQHSESRLRQFGFGVLGAIGTYYGANAMVNSLIMPFTTPVAAPIVFGVGAALAYGGYQAFKHRAEIAAGVDNDPTQEARITRVGKYMGGATLAFAGLTAANVAFLPGVGVAAGALLWSGGLAAACAGTYNIAKSFDIEPAESPYNLIHRMRSTLSST